MKFDYDGSSYTLEFTRAFRQLPDPTKTDGSTIQSKYPYTTAVLWKKDVDGVVTIHRTYTVGAHFREKFTNEQGRLNALRMITKGSSLRKDFKTALWKAYMGRAK